MLTNQTYSVVHYNYILKGGLFPPSSPPNAFTTLYGTNTLACITTKIASPQTFFKLLQCIWVYVNSVSNSVLLLPNFFFHTHTHRHTYIDQRPKNITGMFLKFLPHTHAHTQLVDHSFSHAETESVVFLKLGLLQVRF